MKTELWSAKKRWMVVDDTPAVLEAVAMLLESLDCAEVYRCNSGEEAIEAYAQDCEGFELVVTDLNMPGMDGAELCQCLHAFNPAQVVLLATGSSEINDGEAKAAGFHGLLRKPFSMKTLLAHLENAGIVTAPEPEKAQALFAAGASLSMLSPAWA